MASMSVPICCTIFISIRDSIRSSIRDSIRLPRGFFVLLQVIGQLPRREWLQQVQSHYISQHRHDGYESDDEARVKSACFVVGGIRERVDIMRCGDGVLEGRERVQKRG